MSKELCNQRTVLPSSADEFLEFKDIGSQIKQSNTDYVRYIALPKNHVIALPRYA